MSGKGIGETVALHGSIEVNGVAIGSWGARRTYQINRADSDQGPAHLYEVEATVHGVSWRGQVAHWYDDGPLALAAKVLSAAQKALPARSALVDKDS
jgi:hypothetical protein